MESALPLAAAARCATGKTQPAAKEDYRSNPPSDIHGGYSNRAGPRMSWERFFSALSGNVITFSTPSAGKTESNARRSIPDRPRSPNNNAP